MFNYFKSKETNTLPLSHVSSSVALAIAEDIGTGDINSLLIDYNKYSSARVITRDNMILCGVQWVNEVFYQIDKEIQIIWYYRDGNFIPRNSIIFEVNGRARSLLTAERIVLNFLQMFSGISTKTYSYITALKNTSLKILDTRKTIPHFRLAQKYAVFCGGGLNHRMGLFDGFLIKENHITACNDSLTCAVKKAKLLNSNMIIEVEVKNFKELKDALKTEVDIIMLDNFSFEDIEKAVTLVNHKVKLEVSGNISLNNVVKFANLGVNFISIGDLTKNIKAVDLTMLFF